MPITSASGAVRKRTALNLILPGLFTPAQDSGTSRTRTYTPMMKRFGGEVVFYFGEEMEKHVFNTPTVVIAPKGLVHCPLITRKVEKPYSFTAICLNTEHETKWLGAKPKKGK